jgi:hypothetical protein
MPDDVRAVGRFAFSVAQELRAGLNSIGFRVD